MKPGRFAYHAPVSKDEALELKGDLGYDASFLAGGQSLMPIMNMRLASPEALIDLNRISELDFIEESDRGHRIGAMTRHATVERHSGLAKACPLMPAALGYVGHQVIRNRGTIGGSVAHADAAAELPTALTAVEADVILESKNGTRTVRAEDFFEFHFTTVLDETEMVAAIDVPSLPADAGTAFLEVSRRHGDFAVAAVAAIVHENKTRLVFAGVATRPLIVETEDEDPTEAALAAADEAGIADDLLASRSYRRRLVGVLARRARAAALETMG